MPFPDASRQNLRRFLPLLLLIPLLWWGIVHTLRPDPDRGKLRVCVLDVGQGDCIVVETPSGRTLVIDGGGVNDETRPEDGADVGERVVVPYLHTRGINRVDVLVLTHPHGDHVGGLVSVLREEPVGVVLDGTVLPYPTPAYLAFLAGVKSRHLACRHACRGMRLNLGDGVTADVLNPPSSGTPYGVNPDNSTVNNYSVVLRLTYGRTHFLLMGDAETAAEQNMQDAGSDLTADVLKAGHHGAANASSEAFLARVHPRYAAISCGRHNHFGHPAPATLARFAANAIQTFRTDQNGAITFQSDGQTIKAEPFVP